jgi:hypothetical protein
VIILKKKKKNSELVTFRLNRYKDSDILGDINQYESGYRSERIKDLLRKGMTYEKLMEQGNISPAPPSVKPTSPQPIKQQPNPEPQLTVTNENDYIGVSLKQKPSAPPPPKDDQEARKKRLRNNFGF